MLPLILKNPSKNDKQIKKPQLILKKQELQINISNEKNLIKTPEIKSREFHSYSLKHFSDRDYDTSRISFKLAEIDKNNKSALLENKKNLFFFSNPETYNKKIWSLINQGIMFINSLIKISKDNEINLNIYSELELIFYKLFSEHIKDKKLNDVNQKNSNEKIGNLEKELSNQIKKNITRQKITTIKENNKIIKKDKINENFNEECNQIKLENSKLKVEIEKICERLNFFENYDIGLLMKDLEKTKIESEYKIKLLNDEIFSLKQIEEEHRSLSLNFRANLQKQEKEIKRWILISGENQKKSEFYQNEYDVINFKYKQVEEISSMQYEEIQAYIFKYKDLQTQLIALKDKSRIYKLKLDRYTQKKTENQDFLDEKEYKADLFIIKDIQQTINQNNFFQKSLQQSFLNKKNWSGNQTNELKPKEIDLSKYFFTRAPFFKLVENRYSTLLPEYSKSKKVSIETVITLRTIFDCKYNEFLVFNDRKNISRFPEFVYSWLGKYEINSLNKSIKKKNLNSLSISLEDLRMQFLFEVSNTKLNKLWECYTFVEFLEEKCALDEIYFYLHCRYLLFRGNQMAFYEAFHDFIHYIQFSAVDNLLDIILNRHEIEQKSIIKNKLSEKIHRKKDQILLIDSAFVLRILLEYYKQEKQQKFFLIKELFKNQSPNTISFDNFKKLFLFNWKIFTDLEIVEYYRECWGIGQGIVNVDVFLTMANESDFFLRTMKIASHTNLPLLYDLNNNSILPNQSYEKPIKFFQENLNFIIKFKSLLKNLVIKIGVESIEDKFFKMLKIIEDDFKIISDDLQEQYIYNFLFKFLELGLKILNLYSREDILRKNIEEIDLMINCKNDVVLKFIVDTLDNANINDSLKEIGFITRIRKLQKFFRKKIEKWNKNII